MGNFRNTSLGMLAKSAICVLIFAFFSAFVYGSEEHADSAAGFKPGEMIMHHIGDDYFWHFATIGHTHISIPLPVILYSSETGLDVFLSSKFHHGEEAYNGYCLEHGHIIAEDGRSFYDISITKNVAAVLISAVLLLWIFISMANRYKKHKNAAPKGLQAFLEPVVIFIRDEVAVPILGKKAPAYLPYLLTVFFFIWINNLLGLLPGSANVTGNIAVTLTLAVITFLITNIKAKGHYWKHIFMPPGVPVWILPIMVPVEFLGIFIKPAALCIRLFANITAGHMIILSILSLIFIFGQKSMVAGYGISVVSVAFSVFMMFLELLVAVLQAYIFTILSTLFISDAVTDHAHAEDH